MNSSHEFSGANLLLVSQSVGYKKKKKQCGTPRCNAMLRSHRKVDEANGYGSSGLGVFGELWVSSEGS